MRRTLIMEPYIITRTQRQTADTKTIYFVNAAGTHQQFTAGQYVSIVLPEKKLLAPAGKAYSLSSVPSDHEAAITVKAIGEFSRALCALTSGDSLLVSQPYGYLRAELSRPLVFLAGGVGMSPFLSILRSYDLGQMPQEIVVHYSNHTIDDIVFHEELRELQQAYGLTVNYYITRPAKADMPHDYIKGRIPFTEIMKMHADDDHHILICGSVPFVRAAYQTAHTAGIPDSRIATETFFEQ